MRWHAALAQCPGEMHTVGQVMHAEGLVHRDIKPANIMRCLDKRAEAVGGKRDEASYTYKLIDFGTALGVDERVARTTMMTMGSNRGIAAGTAPYMSPEMFKVLCSSSWFGTMMTQPLIRHW